ncbi:conjugal transfer protein TraG N-terminal domain-containing protein [Paludibacterium yongneupense]|uniref:conjugal transfer protein TraG N-terminal domain-containing protein n=1 Tax=Paludibacterium yongneupense TaxID=400061 RepID=UPI000420AF47|nr:conjugal transfer protein TraG N-terminal domain-containing protein [Paludibacterium yongneupense]
MSLFTIYIASGDIDTFQGILNGVAMVFNSGMLSSSTGLGLGAAVLTGLLISLGLILTTGMLNMSTGGGNNLALLGMLVVCYVVLAGPRVTVQIQDVSTGQVEVVDNIPIGVALPSSIVSTLAYSVTEKMETAFSTVNGNYVTMNGEGFLNPLQILMAMRSPPSSMAPDLNASLRQFMLNCSADSANFDATQFMQSADPVGYMLSHYTEGFTTYYSSTANSSQGAALLCSTASTNIQNDIDKFYNNSGSSQTLSAWLTQAMPKGNISAGKYSVADYANAYNEVIGASWGISTSAQQFMMTTAFGNSLLHSFNCTANSGDPSAYQACIQTQTQQFEQWKIDSASSANFFTHLMPTAMATLQALFFAFSPLMFVFAMMTAQHGLNILVKYLLFGLWTQCWLPFAAVINFFIQIQFQHDMAAFNLAHPQGFNLMVYQDFYNHLSEKVALASDMLAATPLLSLALLTGSVMSLNSLAQRWSGKDFGAEKIAAPDLIKPTAGYEAGAFSHGSAFQAPSSANSRQLSWKASEMGSSALSVANQQVASTTTALSHQLSSIVAGGTQKANIAAASQQFSDTLLNSDSSSKSAANSLMTTLGQGQDWSSSERSSIEAFLTTQASAGIGSSTLGASVSAGTAAKIGLDTATAQKLSKALQGSSAWQAGYQNLQSHARAALASSSRGSMLQSFYQQTQSQSFSKLRTEADMASQTLAQTQTQVSTIGADESIDPTMVATQIAHGSGAYALDRKFESVAAQDPSIRASYARMRDKILADPSTHRPGSTFDPSTADALAKIEALQQHSAEGNAWVFKNVVAPQMLSSLPQVDTHSAAQMQEFDPLQHARQSAAYALGVGRGPRNVSLDFTPGHTPTLDQGSLAQPQGAPASPDGRLKEMRAYAQEHGIQVDANGQLHMTDQQAADWAKHFGNDDGKGEAHKPSSTVPVSRFTTYQHMPKN